MKNKFFKLRVFFVIISFCVISSVGWGQAVRDGARSSASAAAGGSSLPLKKVVILTSGLAYYEHSGSLSGNVNIAIPFKPDAVNDALKSLVVSDPSTANPSVTYQSEQTLFQTLRSLKIDLSDDPSMADILQRLKGAEVEIAAPAAVSGKITGVERRYQYNGQTEILEPWLLLNTAAGLKLFNLKEISSISFKDPEIERDLNRALELIASSRNSFTRQLLLSLPGSSSRNVAISYVIPSPVWKVSYRLDLAAEKPLFQGWAIVDNDSDTDWNNVELSLVAGRPSSFVQNLYPPYYVRRPTLPLSIAGTADAASHDQGYIPHYFKGEAADSSTANAASAPMARQRMAAEAEESYLQENISDLIAREEARQRVLSGGAVTTAAGSEAGGQFEFTIKNPVSLDRRMSAMLPLVESKLEARKVIIYNASSSGKHPRLGAELTNSSGMKLPAGPITVYDGGVYAGDALLEFWNEDEKRLISFGEDLSVSVMTSNTNSQSVSAVTISGGIMTITRTTSFLKTYTFKNSGNSSKRLVAEHPKTVNTTLVSPEADEVTQTHYRFTMTLQANKELILTVSEQRPIVETVRLLSRPDVFVSYSSNQEIPARVREALQRAGELKKTADAADTAVKDIEAQKSRLSVDQDRIRRNLEAAGNQTQQGQEYLKRLVALDSEIDALSSKLDKANSDAKAAKAAYENYISGLKL